MDDNFHELEIDKDYISIYGSGPSLLDLSQDQHAEIRRKSFVFGLNFTPLKFQTDAVMWADHNVTRGLNNHFAQNEKCGLWICRKGGVSQNERGPITRESVDHWYITNGKTGIKGGFTAIWLLQLLARHFPSRPILLFGFDQKVRGDAAKWHWKYREMDDHMKTEATQLNSKFAKFQEQFDTLIKQRSHIYNCTPDSNLSGVQKIDFGNIG